MSTFTRNPAVVNGSVGDDHVLFNLSDRQLHVLNPTGAAAWAGLSSEATPVGLAARLARTFRADVGQVRHDIDALLSTFHDEGLCLRTSDLAIHSDERDVSVLGDTPKVPGHRSPQIKMARLGERPSMLGPFNALGTLVTLDVQDQELCADLDRILDPLRGRIDDFDRAHNVLHITVESAAVDSAIIDQTPIWTLRVGDAEPHRISTRDQVIRRVVAEVNGGPLHDLDDAVVFHAAAAEFDSGVVLFPGISNAGKSTLISQLVHRGQKYVTDEAAMVPLGSQNVRPFTKSISIEPGSQRFLSGVLDREMPGEATIDLDPRRIGPGRLSTGGEVVSMIFPTYRAGASTRLTALSSFDGFRSLLANAFDFDLTGQAGFDTIVRLANNVPAFALEHGGAADHLDAIERTAAS